LLNTRWCLLVLAAVPLPACCPRCHQLTCVIFLRFVPGGGGKKKCDKHNA
jgi:hypothetical protein